ncbi:MAG: tetratricopeptide repeat protein [Bradymonadia bacterium]
MRLLWRTTGTAPRVCDSPAALTEGPSSGVRVLIYTPEHAQTLNLNRGLIRERASPYIIWAPGTLGGELRQAAPDFFDGLNGAVWGVEGFTRESVHRVRHAGHRRPLRWTGPGPIDAVLDAALGAGTWLRVSSAEPYPVLRRAAADPRFLAIDGVSTSWDAARVRWALAEARRQGRGVLVNSTETWPGVEDFGDAAVTMTQAAAQLRDACETPGLLAALLELDPELLDRAKDGQRWTPERLTSLARARRPHARLQVRSRRPRGRAVPGTLEAKVAEMERVVGAADAPAVEWVDTARSLGLLDVAEDLLARLPPTQEPAARGRRLVSAGLLADELGRYEEAEALLRETLSIVEKTQGKAHPDYGTSLHNLAGVLEKLGRYEEAEVLLRESLSIDDKTLGSAHPSYGASLHSLAGVLEQQGRYEESEGLLRESLSIKEKTLGSAHPSYGTSLYTLAGVLEKQGRYEEAEGLLRESLSILEKTLGKAHPNYGASLHNLSIVLDKQGRYEEAEGLLRESLAIIETTHGTGHPRYGASLHNLATVLDRQGSYEEAEVLLRESLTIKERTLGTGHPSYGASLHSLASVLERQGRYEEAEVVVRQSLSIVEETVGKGHPSYGASLDLLAQLLWSVGRRDEAIMLARESLSVTENALGLVHPDVGFRCVNLAQKLAMVGQRTEALALAERSVRIFRDALGPSHPTTQQAERLNASLAE